MVMLHIIYFLVIILSASLLIIFRVRYSKKTKIFSDYLFKINDYDTLYILGIINKSGKEEARANVYFQVEDRLFEKYEETNDEEYIKFYDFYYSFVRYRIAFFIIAVVSTLAFFIIRAKCQLI